jgi:hypothetical protein
MNDEERIERFNQELDRLLRENGAPGRVELPEDLPEEDRQALQLARRLKAVDFSKDSRQRQALYRRLLERSGEGSRQRSRGGRWLEALRGTGQAAAWGTLALLLVVLLSWTIRNLVPVPEPAATELPAAKEPVETAIENRFRSDRFHLEATLPAGWEALEGTQLLGGDFVGLVGFNSWGEAGFWATLPESGQTVLAQIPADGAYLVFGFQGGEVPAEDYGPEHVAQDLPDIPGVENCRETGDPPGITRTHFYKWGRLLRVDLYCGPQVSAETAGLVQALLDSWSFDLVPAGDAAWAAQAARQLLPAEVDPPAFPLFMTSLLEEGAGSLSSWKADIRRVTQAEILAGEVVSVTFRYQWQAPVNIGEAQDCPAETCHWWRFEAWPDGQIGLVEEGGAALPVAGEQASAEQPAPRRQPARRWPTSPSDSLPEWENTDQIRARFSESFRRWDTLWADVLITTASGDQETVLHEQIWIDQPDRSLWLSGLATGQPQQIRLLTPERTVLYQFGSEDRSPREIKDRRLAPTPLYKALLPAWGLSRRDGEFSAVEYLEGQDPAAILDRDTVVVDYTNIERRLSDRFWVDAATGVILQWVHFPARDPVSGEEETFLGIVVTDIEFNVEFPNDLFDPALNPPRTFAEDYRLDRTEP